MEQTGPFCVRRGRSVIVKGMKMTIPAEPPVLTDRSRSDYPLGGKKTGPAWRCAWSLLREAHDSGVYLPSSVVAARVTEKVPEVSTDTVKNLLLSAFRFGVLSKVYRDVNSRRQAAFRISDEWLER